MLKKCNNCGIEYNAKRSDSLYCSAKCRQQSKRSSETNKRDTVTDNTVQSVTDNIYHGGPGCDCGMCQANRAKPPAQQKTINHGPYKTASGLQNNEINRVPVPGDKDYKGRMRQDKNGSWICGAFS